MAAPRIGPASRTASGFTMVELLVVISIIIVLAGLLMPAIMAAMRKAHETQTLNLIHQCEVAAQSFFNDYGDYPPSTWAEVDELFKIPNPNPADIGTGSGWDGGLFSGISGTNGYRDQNSSPSTINEGIEVLTYCLATRNGGPYLQPSADQLGNTDGDHDDADLDGDGTNDVRQATNPYFGGNQVFELVDYWGNPLVYFHNRDYAAHDGWTDANLWADRLVEAVTYADSEGQTYPCYARWDDRVRPDGTSYGPGERPPLPTQNYPNLDGFQLYSWGYDAKPGCDESTSTPGTPNPNEPGYWPGWTGKSGNLCNWSE